MSSSEWFEKWVKLKPGSQKTHTGTAMNNVTELPTKDITQDPLRIIEDPEGTTVIKNSGDYPVTRYTKEEMQFLFEYEMQKRMPWGAA